MVKKKNKYKKILIIILVFLFLVSLITLVIETDWIFKRPGSEYETKIDVSNIVYPLTGAGSIILKRYSLTPLGVEMVSLENNKTYDYFVINEGEIHKEIVTVSIPSNMLPGKYCYYVEIIMQDQSFEERKCFSVN